jgi:hypothetical protein
MNHRAFASVFTTLALALAAACGGAQPEPVQPTGPSPSSNALPSESAPSASPSTGTAPAASSAAPAASTPPATTSAPAAGGAPGPGQWDTWSHDQKMAYMKSDVMPKMSAAFHDFDTKKYGEAKCTLCHGKGASDGSFKMPNPDLPKLPATPDGFKKLAQQKPKYMEFMGKQVKPTMAQLLGEPELDPATGKGFGCFECHTKK